MTSNVSSIAKFFKPALCANNNQEVQGAVVACQKGAAHICGGCNLVQYCSKECQVADWKHHKASCKSALMSNSWKPQWFCDGRWPDFIGHGKAPKAPFGANKYLWGNMPALDVLKVKENEGETCIACRDLAILFAASGDLRNVVKSVVGIPETFQNGCRVVLNDREFIIVARNAIMLMVALCFDAETAVPMIIHLWYSAALPHAMIDALQSSVLVMIQDVCAKIQDKPADSLQGKTFIINGRILRLVLSKEDWFKLSRFFAVPDTLTLEKTQQSRLRVALAPERVDYRERAMLMWPPCLREVDKHFREEGVLLPFGSSSMAFDTPNPTLFQDGYWPMQDSACPRDGWEYCEYMEHAQPAKADELGAIFFYLRHLLVKFCARLHDQDISFEMFCMDAQNLGKYVRDLKFDRIEISNICDRGYLGPYTCIERFAPLLKSKAENPKATLLMLFLNAAAETEKFNELSAKSRSDMASGVARLQKYMPVDHSKFRKAMSSGKGQIHPEFILRMACQSMLKDWDHWFNIFLKETDLVAFMKLRGVRIKNKNTIIQPWPYKVEARTTKAEFDVLRASGTSGWERYMELEIA